MQHVAVLLAPLALGMLLASCNSGPTDPPFYGPQLPRAEALTDVDVTLQASTTSARSGDSVTFTITATNRSAVRVQLGQQCGPMMDVAVRAPSGGEQSALVGNRTNVAFDCPLPSTFFADPGQSRTIEIRWRAPNRAGVYEARGGLRRVDGLGNESAALAISVR